MRPFVEPTRRLPLRWGTYGDRYVAGLLYLFAGSIILLSTNTYAIGFLLLGTTCYVGAWFILPARGSRRLIAFGPSLIATLLQLTGPQIAFALAVPLFAWLLVRERPLRGYLVLIFPVAVGVVLAERFDTSHDVPFALGIETVVVVGCAWLARYLATTRKSSRIPTTLVAGETSPRRE